MTLADEVIALRTENGVLRAENAQLRADLTQAVARLAALDKQQARPAPPPFVKANRPPRPPGAKRKKRAPEHNQARRRTVATRIERHALERCPACTYPLTGESLDYTRQVIELPAPQPVVITEHQVLKRHCPHCDAWRSPHLDLHAQVLGHSRIGQGIASLIAYLRTTLRLTVRAIQTYLDTLHGLRLSVGEIVAVLHQVHAAARVTLAALTTDLRQRPVIHADETGWRQDGQNGYVWTFATPGDQPIRYYEHDASRGQPVLARILGLAEGQTQTACLVSDFYAGYNDYAGPQQRCWVHLGRDLHELQEAYPADAAVLAWAQAVRRLHDEAQVWRQHHTDASESERAAIYQHLVGQVRELGLAYAQQPAHPCQVLAKRLLRHQDELFQFVLRADVSADNNLAERAIRPLVVIRKISGGTRSERGTVTRLGLASLFGTWQARGLNPFTECLALLRQSAPRAP